MYPHCVARGDCVVLVVILSSARDTLSPSLCQLPELPAARLPDKVTLATRLDRGLELYRVSCPVGVLLVIFEARPEVLVQIAALAVKSGNAVILKGGKEARHSLTILHQTVVQALLEAGLPAHAVQLIFARHEITPLLQLNRYIDLVIPRGSKELVRSIQAATRIPGKEYGWWMVSVFRVHQLDLSFPSSLNPSTQCLVMRMDCAPSTCTRMPTWTRRSRSLSMPRYSRCESRLTYRSSLVTRPTTIPPPPTHTHTPSRQPQRPTIRQRAMRWKPF